MNVGKQVQNQVYTSQTASKEKMEAMKQKLQDAKANGFEGMQEVKPNFKDGKTVSNQASEISKNLKEASSEIKEMLKNPNAFTDCFPTKPSKDGKPNIQQDGVKPTPKEPLSSEQQAQKLERLQQHMENANTLTPLSPEEASKKMEFFNKVQEQRQQK